MTSYIKFDLWWGPKFFYEVDEWIEWAALSEHSLATKAIRTSRRRGGSTYFVRSGKKQIFVTVDDVKISGVEEGKKIPMTLGIDHPELKQEKLMLLVAGMLVQDSGGLVEYAGGFHKATDLYKELREYDSSKDVVPLLDLAPGESPF